MIANYHTHTPRCNHAEGSEIGYIQAALQAGLQTLGFADHSPYLFPDGYTSGFRMEAHELPDYANTVRQLRREYADCLDIRLGVELEYYPSCFQDTLALLRDNGIEYAILGQHFLGDEMNQPYSGRSTDSEDILARYCSQSMAAMNTGLFTYFAHPDLINYRGDETIYCRYIRQLCREAKRCNMPLEINFLGLAEGRNYPNFTFWEIAGEEGCDVIFGCDAHRPEMLIVPDVEKKAMALVNSYGLHLLDTIELRSI